jgi:hypothetical protein
MTRALTTLLSLASLSAVTFLCSCGDSDGTPDPKGAGLEVGKPPGQKAIYLRAKHARPPGTTFKNSATLTMADANLLMRRGEADVSGKATTIMRDLWEVVQVSPTERTFTIEEMSLSNDSTISGDRKDERSESTLANIPFTITRSTETSDWQLLMPEQKLTHLQQGDLRMLGNLWSERTEDLYPEEALDLGETWNPDPKSVGLIVSPRLKVEAGEVSCRLEQITVLRGERCGKISIDIDITGTFETGGGSGMKVQIALTGTILRSLYKNFDMRTELKGPMQMEMELPGQDTTISIDGVAEILQRAEMLIPQTQ